MYNNRVILPGMNATGGGTSGRSLLCNDNQRNTGNYTFTAVDGITDEPVAGVSVMYSCGSESCIIETLDNGTYTGALPVCLGGVLSLQKEGYVCTTYPLNTKVGEGDELDDITIEPYRTVNFSVNKIKFVKQGVEPGNPWIRSGEEGLQPNQEAVVIMEKEQVAGQCSHIQVVSLNYTNQKETVNLVPGKYSVTVMMNDKSSIIIPEEEREIEIIGSLYTEDYTMPEVRFNESSPWMLGSMDAEFTLSTDVNTASEVVFKVLAFEMGDVPEANRKLEDMQIMGNMTNYTNARGY